MAGIQNILHQTVKKIFTGFNKFLISVRTEHRIKYFHRYTVQIEQDIEVVRPTICTRVFFCSKIFTIVKFFTHIKNI